MKINNISVNSQISFREGNHKLLDFMKQQRIPKNIPTQDTKENGNGLAKKIAGGVTALGLTLGGILFAAKRKCAIPKETKKLAGNLCKKFPELDIFSDAERKMFKLIRAGKEAKIDKAFKDGILNTSLLDIEYYKDDFLLNVINHARSLKVFRETKNPKLKELFHEAPQIYGVHDGIMIHGSNKSEKMNLFNYFLEQAKKHDFEIVHINSHNRTPGELQTEFGGIMRAGKEKFHKEQKHTMIVFEDVDELLTEYVGNKKVNFLTGVWNKNVINCGRDGVMTLTTAGDIEKFDTSCIRGGRVTKLIDIDTALARQAEADALKI